MSESSFSSSSMKQKLSSTASAWACSVCMGVLGEDVGLVPMASSDCEMAAHMLCLTCFTSLPSRMGAPVKVDCPTCRAPTSFKVLLELVATSGDEAAVESCAIYQQKLREQKNPIRATQMSRTTSFRQSSFQPISRPMIISSPSLFYGHAAGCGVLVGSRCTCEQSFLMDSRCQGQCRCSGAPPGTVHYGERLRIL
jgi:hypothetical protein